MPRRAGRAPPRDGTAPSARAAPGSRDPRPCRRRASCAVTPASSPAATAKPWFCEVTSTLRRAVVEHRMVRAAMAERQLERLLAGREREQLMTEADAEHRCAPEQLLQHLRLARQRRQDRPGPARGARRHSPRRCPRRRRAGRRSTAAPFAGEPAQDRALAAVVDHCDPDRALRGERVLLTGGDAGDEAAPAISAARARPSAPRRPPSSPLTAAARIAPLVAQMQDERACVDTGETDEAALVQPVGPLEARAPHASRPPSRVRAATRCGSRRCRSCRPSAR